MIMPPNYLSSSISLIVTLRARFLVFFGSGSLALNQSKQVPLAGTLFLFLLPEIQRTNHITPMAIKATGKSKINALKNTNNKLKIINATKTSVTIPKKLIFSPIPDFLD